MKRLTVAVAAMLLILPLWFAPLSAQAMTAASPTITSPANGAVVPVGLVDVGIDFTAAPTGAYTVTLLTDEDDDEYLVDSEVYNYDGSNPQAAFSFGPLPQSGAYALRVITGDAVVARSGFSAIARPGAPSEVDVVPVSQRATLVWQTPVSDGESSITSYQVQRGAALSTRRTLSPETRSYSFRNLTNGRRYTFYVRAQSVVGFGPWVSASATPARRPDAPARTRASSSSHRARLYWGYRAGGSGGAAITAYQVQRGSNLRTRTTRSRTARSHLFTGLTNGTTYRLYVRARNRVGYGPWARATARPHRATRPAPSAPSRCTPGYSPCLPPASDYDCEGGGGNGPEFVDGPVYVTGSDPYELDSDGDGVACEQ